MNIHSKSSPILLFENGEGSISVHSGRYLIVSIVYSFKCHYYNMQRNVM